uniref:Uncharacterized protein n=1 Tax=Anguilla anguilla TaxID=7936 RepID=A0A0E9RHB4_ANGAN
MAADVGSMFQYWKKFDLRRLQVSAIFYLSGEYENLEDAPPKNETKCAFWGVLGNKISGVALIDIRN